MIIKIMSKRKSVLGSEGGTCYKDGPLPQVQCLVLKGGGGTSGCG